MQKTSGKPANDHRIDKMKNGSLLKRGLIVGAACAALFVGAIPAAQAGPTTLTTSGWLGEYVTVNYNGANHDTAALAFIGATFAGSPIDPFWCVDLSKTVPYPPWSI